MTASIYKQIYDAIEHESLPDDFELPEEGSTYGGMKWAPGAMDGVYMYHMAPAELTDADTADMEAAVEEASSGDREAAERLFHKFTEEHRAISAIDALQRYIAENREDLDTANLYHTAVWILKESEHIECVKLAMAILEIYRDIQEEIRDVIYQLGLYDEFTLPAVWNMTRWKEGNQDVFDTARHTHGWGRIHAVNSLKPETDEIRTWLLTEGVKNNVSPSYSALTCWNNGEAESRLSVGCTETEYKGILRIMDAMLDEGPVIGISALEKPESVLLTLLEKAEEFPLEGEDYRIIFNIRTYCTEAEPPLKKAAQKADTILHSPACHQAVTEAVENGNCLSLAEELGIPFLAQLYENMRKHFDTTYFLCGHLMAEPAYTEKTLDLFRRNLPLSEMTGDLKEETMTPEDFLSHSQLVSVLFTLRELPLTGTDLIRTGLFSTSLRDRLSALSVLEHWVHDSDTPLKELSEDLYDRLQELNKQPLPGELRERIAPLLEGDTVFEHSLSDLIDIE